LAAATTSLSPGAEGTAGQAGRRDWRVTSLWGT
jgi:hypothetical protein